jgi:putative MFS transporter
MPFVLLPLLEDHGAGAVFVCIAIAMALVVADIGLLGPRTTGLPLEQVTAPDTHDAVHSTTAALNPGTV